MLRTGRASTWLATLATDQLSAAARATAPTLIMPCAVRGGAPLPISGRRRAGYGVTRPAPPTSRGQRHPFVERADDLGDPGGGPEIEEGALEEPSHLSPSASPGLLVGLAGPHPSQVADHPVLVIDGRVLDVAIQLAEIAGEEHRDGYGRELLAILLVRVRPHEVGVAARRLLGQALHQHAVAVAG